MSIESVVINGNIYQYHNPDNYKDIKLFLKQKKRIREKIRACENGCYKDKLTRKGIPYYNDYPKLIEFLDSITYTL